MSARTGAEGADVNTWLQSWTIFYWAWWVSWTPFVGMFIARISRGRTIRQFVAGVLLVPSVVSLVWFAVFGGAAINVQQGGVDLAGEGGVEEQLFRLLDQYPIATIASVLVMMLVAIFFVSGADAASIVMGSLSERGTIKPSRGTVDLLGCRDRRGRGGHAAGRRRGRAHRPADDHDHRRAAVRARDGRHGGGAGEGSAARPEGGAPAIRRRGGRQRGDARRHRTRRRLHHLGGEGSRRARRSSNVSPGARLRPGDLGHVAAARRRRIAACPSAARRSR